MDYNPTGTFATKPQGAVLATTTVSCIAFRDTPGGGDISLGMAKVAWGHRAGVSTIERTIHMHVGFVFVCKGPVPCRVVSSISLPLSLSVVYESKKFAVSRGMYRR